MTLEELLAQLQLGQGDKDAARKQAIAQAGFALMGAPKGREWEAVGRAGFTGMGAYNNALAGAQQGRMDGLKMRSTAMDVLARQREFDDANLERETVRGYQPQTMPQMPDMAPTPENAAKLAQMPAPKQPGQYEYYMGLAEQLKAKGLLKPAMQMEAQAAKYAPQPKELKESRTLMQNGKRVTVNIYKDGSHEILPFDPDMEKAHFANVGDRIIAADPFTGEQRGGGLGINVSPDARLSADTTRRGQDLVNARARDANAVSAGNAGLAKTGELRKEFNALPQVKAYDEVQPVLQSAREAVGTDTAAADLNLIYAAAKIMDPTSVVRESETAMVVSSGSPAQRFMGQFNYVAGGGRLTPATRAALMKEVESRGRGYESGYKAARKAYEGIADKQGVPKDQVFIEPFAQSAVPSPAALPPGVTQAAIQAELRRRQQQGR